MIYFDNAATTFPKPGGVISAVNYALGTIGGNPGRGSHKMSERSSSKIYECREALSEFFGAPGEDNVVFTLNTTYALNTAIKALARRGDHILISSMEHNSVYRPVKALADRGMISFTVFDAFAPDVIAEIARKLRQNTSLLVCAHASNVCGRVLPIGDIGAFLRKRGVKFIVDGAQSAGKYPVNVKDDHIDALCVPGHKGLYGPMGCGAMICGEGFSGDTVIEGGGGINSLDEHMPDFLPERFEAGTLPTPAIVGLSEGIRFVRSIGADSIREHEERLCRECAVRLREMDRIKLYSESGVILFNVENVPSPHVCKILDREGICVRGGFHCAPLAHRALGTGDNGAIRVSFGYFNSRNEVIRFCDLLSKAVSEI